METKHDLKPQIHEEEEENISEAKPRHPLLKKRVLKRSLLILALLVIPFIASLLASKNATNPVNPILATVENQPIYLSDVRNVAMEQYQASAIDKNALHLSFDTLIERLILDREAKRLSLSVSDKEINDKLQQNFSNSEEIPNTFRIVTKYKLLREKIIEKDVESRKAYSIGFYIASYDEQQGTDVTNQERALFSKQRAESKQALNQIEEKLKKGELPLQVATTIFNTYPALQPVLAVNGYILNSTNDKTVLENPKTYTYDKDIADQPFFSSLYTMQPNEVRRIEDESGSGGDVIQLKAVNLTGAKDYDQWLDTKKRELVKIYNYNI